MHHFQKRLNMNEKQFGHLIEIVPLYAVKSVTNNGIQLREGYGFDSIECAHYPEPSEETGNSVVGAYNFFSLQVRVEKLSPQLAEKYSVQSNVLLILYKEDGNNSLIVGNLENPVTMILVPGTESDLLSFTRSSFISVL